MGFTNLFLRSSRNCVIRDLRTCRGDLGDLSIGVVFVVVDGMSLFVDVRVVVVDGEGGRLARALNTLLKKDVLRGVRRCSR